MKYPFNPTNIAPLPHLSRGKCSITLDHLKIPSQSKYACHCLFKMTQNVCRGAILVSLVLLNAIRYLACCKTCARSRRRGIDGQTIDRECAVSYSTQYVLPLSILPSMPTVLQKTEMIEEAFAGYGHTHTHTRIYGHTIAWVLRHVWSIVFFITACLWTLQKMRGLNWSAVLELFGNTGGRCHRWAFTCLMYHTHLKLSGFGPPDLECNYCKCSNTGLYFIGQVSLSAESNKEPGLY